jgi:hypothetical protein
MLGLQIAGQNQWHTSDGDDSSSFVSRSGLATRGCPRSTHQPQQSLPLTRQACFVSESQAHGETTDATLATRNKVPNALALALVSAPQKSGAFIFFI